MKNRVKTILLYALLYVVACRLLLSMMDRILPDDPFAMTWYPLMLAALVLVANFLHIAIHELGHLVCGLLSGYRFVSIRVFSFMVVRDQGKLRFRRLRLLGTGGQCVMMPPELRDGNFPVLLTHLGGPLANLLTALVCWVVFPLLPRYSFRAMLCAAMCMMGLVTGIVNGVPMRTRSVDNDGRNALSLVGNREARVAFWQSMMVSSMAAQGRRPKDMPEEWFRMPTDEAMQNTMVATRAVSRCGWLMDQLRFEEAAVLLEHVLTIPTGLMGVQRQLLTCDRIFCELVGQCRTNVVIGYYTSGQKQFMKAARNLLPVIRTEYATALLLERDAAHAAQLRQAFDKAARTWPYEVDVISEGELMNIAWNRAGEIRIP